MSDTSTPKRIVLAAVALAAASIPMTFGAKSAVAQSADPTPLVSVAPEYPPRARSRGQNGTVTLRFTVAVDGTTKDIEVVESSSSVFERSAVEAVSKWRYEPRRENGVAVERRGLQTVLRFGLGRR